MFSRTAFHVSTAAVVASAACWAGCSSSSSPSVGSGMDAGTGSSSSSGSSSGAGSSSGGGSGGGSGGSSGSSSGSSSGGATDAGPTCPTVPCASGTCCADLTTDVPVCTPTCAADDTIACLGAAGCGGSTPDCCATDVLDGMDAGQSFPHCTTASLTTKCGKCASSIQLSCTATQLLHVCQAASECADDTANPNCCLVAGYHVCVNGELKVLGSLSCL